MGAAGSVEAQVASATSAAQLEGLGERLLKGKEELARAALEAAQAGETAPLAAALEEAGVARQEDRDKLLEAYKAMPCYLPRPIDTTAVEMPEYLTDLTEKLAENAHECWAEQRISQGWTWGKERNDELKHHPCLIAYGELSDEEKSYDRITAMNTLKLLLACGYDIRPPATEQPNVQ